MICTIAYRHLGIIFGCTEVCGNIVTVIHFCGCIDGKGHAINGRQRELGAIVKLTAFAFKIIDFRVCIFNLGTAGGDIHHQRYISFFIFDSYGMGIWHGL